MQPYNSVKNRNKVYPNNVMKISVSRKILVIVNPSDFFILQLFPKIIVTITNCIKVDTKNIGRANIRSAKILLQGQEYKKKKSEVKKVYIR